MFLALGWAHSLARIKPNYGLYKFEKKLTKGNLFIIIIIKKCFELRKKLNKYFHL
jgi:hypothetical protein